MLDFLFGKIYFIELLYQNHTDIKLMKNEFFYLLNFFFVFKQKLKTLSLVALIKEEISILSSTNSKSTSFSNSV